MLMVSTELRASTIQGIGLFLLEPATKGQLIWRFDARIDAVFVDHELEHMPALLRMNVEKFATWSDLARVWVWCGDDARYINHSETPNTLSKGPAFGENYAGMSLTSGTELTIDYRAICDRAAWRWRTTQRLF